MFRSWIVMYSLSFVKLVVSKELILKRSLLTWLIYIEINILFEALVDSFHMLTVVIAQVALRG